MKTTLFDKYRTFVCDADGNFKYQSTSTFSKRIKKIFKVFYNHIKHTRNGSVFDGYSIQELEKTIKNIEMRYSFDKSIINYSFNENIVLD